MAIITIQGIQFKTTGKRLTAPRSKVVLSYLEAVKKGKGLAEKYFKNSVKK
jgi:hypothetical protein